MYSPPGQRLVTLSARCRAARGTDAAELLALETRYEELAGWFAPDIGDERTAHGHTALALLDRADVDGIWGSWLDEAYIGKARARSLATLGEYTQAAAGFDSAIAALPPAYRRDRGVYLARAARDHAGTGNTTAAARIGVQAVGIAAETGSARIIGQLDRLDQALAPADGEDGVAEFRAALDRIVLHPA
ncbi:hypothetical protein [Streptomyces sp. NPDC057677]|uniref:hypothetical protein n=1 Tax=unclassified Streptomyces TaxID=2593676 RepID=UPI0036B52EB3